MRKWTAGICVATCVLLCELVVHAQAQHDRIDDVAFIAGAWQCDIFGGHAEETWLPPRDGTMVGVFRLSWSDRDERIYEILLIEQIEDRVEMRFRHFSPRLEPWEDEADGPHIFVLEESDPNHAVFVAPDTAQKPNKMTFTLRADDRLHVLVEGIDANQDGVAEESFEVKYTRKAAE